MSRPAEPHQQLITVKRAAGAQHCLLLLYEFRAAVCLLRKFVGPTTTCPEMQAHTFATFQSPQPDLVMRS